MTAPADPRAGRQDALILFLKASLVIVMAAAVGTLIWGDELGQTGTVLVATLVIAPLSRVAWVAIRWLRKGDHRYALAALGLLSMIAATGLALLV